MANGQNVKIDNSPTNILGQLVAAQLKEVEKQGKLQVQQAVEGGVPLDHIAQQLQAKNEAPEVGLQPLGSQQGQLNQALAGQPQKTQPQMSIGQPSIAPTQPIQAPTQPQAQAGDQQSFLNRLIKFSNFGTVGDQRRATTRLTEAEADLKELEAEQGGEIGKAKRAKEEKIREANQKRQDDFFKSVLRPDPLPDASNKSLSLIESSLTALDNINSILGIKTEPNGTISISNKDLLTNNNWLSQNRQALIRARDVYLNKALRRDSGAAITPAEEKDFKKKFGFDVSIKSFMKNADVIAQALVEAQQQLKRDRTRILPDENLKKFIQSEIQLGTPREEIFSFLEGKGTI